MKYIYLLMLLVYANIAFSQYLFKYEGTYTHLEATATQTSSNTSSNSHKIINIEGKANDRAYVSKIYKTTNGDSVSIMPKISVIITPNLDINQITKQFGDKLSFKKKIGRVYVFNCNVSTSDEVLSITTALSENNDVIGCDAFTDAKFELYDTNPKYSQQYYLHSSSSNSLSINAPGAWEIASGLGKNVTVAVIDEGVEHNHEDLLNVLDGFTGCNPLGKGDPEDTNTFSSCAHGVACAGIIGAANNDIGVRGIASNVKILPANIATAATSGSDSTMDPEYAAEAIMWACEKADILSCSWGNSSGLVNVAIRDAIKYAQTNGRNGKGCVIVFSSGNDASHYNNIGFPASVEGVISVGAVDKTGKIWNYSQRGKGLCLVAPS